jgi:hypothetical protein
MRLCSFFCSMLVLVGICAAQETNFAVGPQYLMTSGSPLFARPIATPSLSLGESRATTIGGTSETNAGNEAVATTPGLQGQSDLLSIYYGVPQVSVIEISKPETSARNLPASITNVGVMEATDMPSLRQRGFGVTLPEAASYWKTHKRSASRVYTNRDIERLQHGS